MEQISIFDFTAKEKLKIDKPIRLIELFSGYGSQALALRYLGIPFENWKISEWAIKSIQAYKDLHNASDNNDYSADKTIEEIRTWLCGRISADYNTPLTSEQIKRRSEKELRTIYNNMQATNNIGSITNIVGGDLQIVDTDKYEYIMTYSFPCQDLSSAGKGAGMEKGSGTRSGLLWEVERLLKETKELPQVLLMENVPEVIGSKNIKHFAKWVEFLDNIGYHSKWGLLNAKDFGIAQNRNRCFMVSVLGDYYYDMPTGFKLEHVLKDFLDKEVDESYYLKDGTIRSLNLHKERHEAQGNGFGWKPSNVGGVAHTIKTEGGYRPDSNFIIEQSNDKCKQVGMLVGGKWDKMHDIAKRVYGANGISPTLHTCGGGNLEPKILEEPLVYDGFNQQIRADQTTVGCLTRNVGADLKRNGQGIIEPLAYDEQNKYVRKDGVVGTLTTDGSSPKHNNRVIETSYRVRKLTERECFKLMGVKQEDFEKIRQNQSKSSCYHLAGDSIVTTVLMAIFGQMFDVDWKAKINELAEELTNEQRTD